MNVSDLFGRRVLDLSTATTVGEVPTSSSKGPAASSGFTSAE
jgi:hypothetical protein